MKKIILQLPDLESMYTLLMMIIHYIIIISDANPCISRKRILCCSVHLFNLDSYINYSFSYDFFSHEIKISGVINRIRESAKMLDSLNNSLNFNIGAKRMIRSKALICQSLYKLFEKGLIFTTKNQFSLNSRIRITVFYHYYWKVQFTKRVKME